MAVYFGTWLPRPKNWPDKRLGLLFTHVCFTEDGSRWSGPVEAYERNYWLWRVRYRDGNFYSPAYSWDDPREKHRSFLDLLTSQDGIKWKKVCRIAGVKDQPDEADLFFQSNDELWCVARSSLSPDYSFFYSSKPPYQKWERVDLKVTIHCPVFCESDGRLYVAGRRRTDAPWKPQLTPAGNTGIFTVEKGKVEPLLALPSDGDAAYPGLISRETGKFIISYYSQHAYLSGVICSLTPHSADIYIAEVAIK